MPSRTSFIYEKGVSETYIDSALQILCTLTATMPLLLKTHVLHILGCMVFHSCLQYVRMINFHSLAKCHSLIKNIHRCYYSSSDNSIQYAAYVFVKVAKVYFP